VCSDDFANGLPFRVAKPDAGARPVGGANSDAGAKPYLFNSPHSGRHYSKIFRQMSCLDDHSLRLSEDRFVDLIFAPLVDDGAVFMAADFPRAYMDVNREAFELDASMFIEPCPDIMSIPSLRVQAGFGSVARLVRADKEIYDHKLSWGEALERITTLYHPYHRCLEQQLNELRAAHGYAVLIDCHSMPGMGPGTGPDIILGDRYGCSCAPALTDWAEKLLRDFGFDVIRNQPYAGGYITSHYGRPADALHALQIEINRDLYLDPHSLEENSGFASLCATIVEFGRQLMQLDSRCFLPSYQHAAE